MKTEDDPRQSQANPGEGSLRILLERSPDKPLPSRVDGLLLGTLVRLDEAGCPWVSINGYANKVQSAQSLIPLSDADIAAPHLVLGFTNGDPTLPLVLGRLHPPAVQPHENTTTRRLVLEAEEELELRCGESVVLLRADGHIDLRGRYITSHADAGQRIRGGSVQIN